MVINSFAFTKLLDLISKDNEGNNDHKIGILLKSSAEIIEDNPS